MRALWKVNIVRLSGDYLNWYNANVEVAEGLLLCLAFINGSHYENLDGLKCAESPLERQLQRKNKLESAKPRNQSPQRATCVSSVRSIYDLVLNYLTLERFH